MTVMDKMDVGPNKRFLLVYGSQTGQAKAIAEDLADKAASHGLEADLQSAEGVDRKFHLQKERVLVMVCSTTGEGEPPDNASKMLRRLKNRSLKQDHLSQLRYALLGLGDTNYTNFCNCPKEFNQRLQELGATAFYAPGWADDGVGLDLVCDPWIEGLWPALQKEVATSIRDVGSMSEPSLINGGLLTASKLAVLPVATKGKALEGETLVASLLQSISPLRTAALSVPAEPTAFLDLKWRPDLIFNPASLQPHNGIKFPSAASDVFQVDVDKSWRMTSDDSVKTALDVCLSTKDSALALFRPGDAFGVIVTNLVAEVDIFLERLFGSDETKGGPDVPFELSVMEETSKVKAEVPEFIPALVTPRYLLEHLLDIRSIPKKALLRMLGQFCSDELEQRRLLELASKQGGKDYDAFVRQPGIGVVDIINTFKSCKLPLERLVEQLPRLQARSYSISSSPLRCPDKAHFVFNVVEMPSCKDFVGEPRLGLCTGWLDRITKERQIRGFPTFDSTDDLASLSISDQKQSLSVFLRSNQWFHHPDDRLDRPLLMVGPGTGVAPFLGFLQHREILIKTRELKASDVGETWLFYGCRHRDKDYLYKTEFERLHKERVLTHLVTSFSRDEESDTVTRTSTPKYVQHSLAKMADRVADVLLNPDAMIFVCGDAKNMARNVNEAFIQALVSAKPDMTQMAAMRHLADIRDQKRYLQDVWA